MNGKNQEKQTRLKQRLYELNDINEKIGKLALYLKNFKSTNNKEEIEGLKTQLNIMISYKQILEKRILDTNY